MPACIAALSVTYTSHRAQALALVFIGAVDIYVSLYFGPAVPDYFSTGNALLVKSRLCHPFIYGLWLSCLPLAVSCAHNYIYIIV
jgi:hypothetical protein